LPRLILVGMRIQRKLLQTVRVVRANGFYNPLACVSR
jgi:hypothetical protein